MSSVKQLSQSVFIQQPAEETYSKERQEDNEKKQIYIEGLTDLKMCDTTCKVEKRETARIVQ